MKQHNNNRQQQPPNMIARKKNNYITQQIQKGGENFLEKMNPSQIQNDSPRILRDLAKGNIDIVQAAGVLCNDQVAKGLYDFVTRNHMEIQAIYISLSYRLTGLQQYGYTKQTNQEVEYLEELVSTYRFKKETYDLILNFISSFWYNRDINILISMVPQVRRYKSYI